MKRLALAPIAMALALTFALVGCAEEEGGPVSQPAEKDALVGYWQLDSSASIGLSSYIWLEDDDSAHLILGDSFYEGTWAVSEGEAKLSLVGAEEVGLAYTGERLVIGGDEGSRLVYAKGDESLESEFVDDGSQEAEALEEGEAPVEVPVEDELEDEAEPQVEEVAVVDEVIEDVAPITLVDDGTCSITVTGKGTDFTADPCYRLYILNKSDKALYFTVADEFTVSGKRVEAGMGDVVEPEEEIDATLYLSRDDLGGGPELLVDVNGAIDVEVDETYEPVASYSVHID